VVSDEKQGWVFSFFLPCNILFEVIIK